MSDLENDDVSFDRARPYLQSVRLLSSQFPSPRAGFQALHHVGNILESSLAVVYESSLFRGPTSSGSLWPMIPGPEYWHFVLRRGHRWGRFLIESLLSNPDHFEPPAIWALFWALAHAEHQFLNRFVPFWSHEERMTGHLVSVMIERLEGYGHHWNNLARWTEGENSRLRVWYADTATARQEQITGADLGLIIQAKLPHRQEFWKSARFQAKKTQGNGVATIDLDQVRALAQANGYLLFYHPFLGSKDWSVTPTVQPAQSYSDEVERAQASARRGPRLGKTQAHTWNRTSVDFATFVTFAIADPESEAGVSSDDAFGAARALVAENLGSPSRVCVVTVGEGTSVVDWQSALQEFMGPMTSRGKSQD